MDAQAKGYVETILGRRRPVTEIHSNILSLRNAAERIAINSVVQGSAADLIKIAMINVHRRAQSARSGRARCCFKFTTSSSSKRRPTTVEDRREDDPRGDDRSDEAGRAAESGSRLGEELAGSEVRPLFLVRSGLV